MSTALLHNERSRAEGMTVAGACGREGPLSSLPYGASTALRPPEDALRALLAESAVLQEQMQQLVALADEKLRAMRAADVTALEGCAAREASLLREVCARETAWKAAFARLAQQLPRPGTPPTTLSDVVGCFSEPVRSVSLARMAGLQQSARQLKKKNELAAAVARNLQEHLHGAFATIAAPASDRPTYGPRGRDGTVPSRSWVDTVG